MQCGRGKRIRMDEPPEYVSHEASADSNTSQEATFPSSETPDLLPQSEIGIDSFSLQNFEDALNMLDDTSCQNENTHSHHDHQELQANTSELPSLKTYAKQEINTQQQLAGLNLDGRITRSQLRSSLHRAKKDYSDVTGENASLFMIIRTARIPLSTIVDELIDVYKTNREVALLAIMQLFINASGCKGKITPGMASGMEHAGIIRKMTEEFDEESGEYPLVMGGLQWKKFRTNFCDFIAQLVRQCQYSIIYDQYLMDNIISLLTGLSDSQVRAFRHTATLAAMKLMTALVDVAMIVSVSLNNTQRQYESEKQKTKDKRASDRLENLLTKKQELEENMGEVKNMLTFIFKSVFVHRYRDTLPDIRAICMTEIGMWMQKFPRYFLDDSYLKYIGWTLHDKVGEVRLRCLQALHPLYGPEEIKGKLELFTSKFKDRIVGMTLDRDYDVSVQAVNLVTSILNYNQDMLADKDCEQVYELVYSSHRAVAHAAGEFLSKKLFVPDEDPEVQRTGRGKKRLPNTPLIRDLIQFFIESELHEHGAYLVDSLIESNDMMKDWECMTDLLLEEPGPLEDPLDDKQENSLIEIMVCSIKQASTGEAPVGRGLLKKVTSSKEAKQIQDDKQKLTEHFIKMLPPLLSKFSADPDKLTNLLIIPQYFELEIYTTSRQEPNLDLLLKRINDITEKHHDTNVLEVSAKSLEILCSEGLGIYTRCDVQRSTLIDSIVHKFKQVMDDWTSLIEGEELPDEDDTYDVINSMKKLSIFYSCHSLRNWDVVTSIFEYIEGVSNGSTHLPEEATTYCISSCYFSILWDMNHIQQLLEAGGQVEDEVNKCKARLTKLTEILQEILINKNNHQYKREAYLVVCDLLIMFSSQHHSFDNAAMSSLSYEPNVITQRSLNDFVQTNVFVSPEDDKDEHSKVAELHKRRNFLASYCKLITYCILPVSCAADIFRHYTKCLNDYGDIIKTTIGKAREISKTQCASAMMLALISVYKSKQQYVEGGTRVGDIISCKELARRFSLTFGVDSVKNRESITTLHREGIIFATTQAENSAEPLINFSFLEVLTEFSNKLMKQDKRTVLQFLEKKVPVGISQHYQKWQPLVIYKGSLTSGEVDHSLSVKKTISRRKREEFDDSDSSRMVPSDSIQVQ